MSVEETFSRERLAAVRHCWATDDHVPRRPELTDFRRRLRFHQIAVARGRRSPIGSRPIAPPPGGEARPVGSRLPLDYARETARDYLTPAALGAASGRTRWSRRIELRSSDACGPTCCRRCSSPSTCSGPRRRSRPRRPCRSHLVAGRTGYRERYPLRRSPGRSMRRGSATSSRRTSRSCSTSRRHFTGTSAS